MKFTGADTLLFSSTEAP